MLGTLVYRLASATNLLSNGSFGWWYDEDAVRTTNVGTFRVRGVRFPVPHDLTLVQDPKTIVFLKDLNVFLLVNIKWIFIVEARLDVELVTCPLVATPFPFIDALSLNTWLLRNIRNNGGSHVAFLVGFLNLTNREVVETVTIHVSYISFLH